MTEDEDLICRAALHGARFSWHESPEGDRSFWYLAETGGFNTRGRAVNWYLHSAGLRSKKDFEEYDEKTFHIRDDRASRMLETLSTEECLNNG